MAATEMRIDDAYIRAYIRNDLPLQLMGSAAGLRRGEPSARLLSSLL
jgi:hypothetical protein